MLSPKLNLFTTRLSLLVASVLAITATGCPGDKGYVTNSILFCTTVIGGGQRLQGVTFTSDMAFTGKYVTYKTGDTTESDHVVDTRNIGSQSISQGNLVADKEEATCFMQNLGQDYYLIDAMEFSVAHATFTRQEATPESQFPTNNERIKGIITGGSIISTDSESTSDYTRVGIRVDVEFNLDKPNADLAPLKIGHFFQ